MSFHGCSLSATVNYHVQPVSPMHEAGLRMDAQNVLSMIVDDAATLGVNSVDPRTSISSIAFEIGRRHGKFHVHFQWDVLSDGSRVQLRGLNERIKRFFDLHNGYGARVYASADVDDHSSNLLRYHANKPDAEQL